MHWFNFQLTILVHITYTLNPDCIAEDLGSKRLKTNYYYYISNYRKHDSLFVQTYLRHHWNNLNCARLFPTNHLVWFDGYSTQFKGAKAWFFVSKYKSFFCIKLGVGRILLLFVCW
jgi:hypothetical protein